MVMSVNPIDTDLSAPEAPRGAANKAKPWQSVVDSLHRLREWFTDDGRLIARNGLTVQGADLTAENGLVVTGAPLAVEHGITVKDPGQWTMLQPEMPDFGMWTGSSNDDPTTSSLFHMRTVQLWLGNGDPVIELDTLGWTRLYGVFAALSGFSVMGEQARPNPKEEFLAQEPGSSAPHKAYVVVNHVDFYPNQEKGLTAYLSVFCGGNSKIEDNTVLVTLAIYGQKAT
jgi:hypothetical protein